MDIHRVLLLCVSSAFIDGRTGLVGAQTDVYRETEAGHCRQSVVTVQSKVYNATEGGSITVTCSLYPQDRKLLWRENKLLATTDDLITGSEKYKFVHINTTSFNVSITQLTKSDSGRYKCGAGRRYVLCEEFEIVVTCGVVTRDRPCLYLTVFFLLLAICLLLLYKYKTRIIHYVNTRLNGRNTEISVDYDDCVAASTGDGSAYQDLNPHSRDLNLYSTLQSDYYFHMNR